MSLESLRFMLGGAIHRPDATTTVYVHHSEEVVCDASGNVPLPKNRDGVTLTPKASAGHPIKLINLTKGTRTQLTGAVTLTGDKPINFVNPAMIAGETHTQASAQGDHIRIFWEEAVVSESGSETAVEVTISPDTFPGTYKVIGDTFIRSEKTGKDEMFQFVIGKAKVTSDVTITLEAEGDPSTFSMTLNVLRDTNERGETEMMKLIRYTVSSGSSVASGNDVGSVGQ